MSKARFAAALVALSCLAAFSTWVIPIRLATERGSSFYNFSCFTDECFYAAHIAPLIDKTNEGNVVNGFSDPSFTPQYYMEMLLRRIVTVTGIQSITVFWIWRVLFPLALAGSLLLLTAVTLRRPEKSWRWPLVLLTSVAAWPLFYCAYELVMPAFPLRHWLERVPTNIEFLLTVLLFALIVFFLRRPDLRRALAVVLMLGVTVYARPYSIIGCGLPLLITVTGLSVTRYIAWRTTLIASVVFAVLLLPLLWQLHQNGLSPEYQAWSARYFTGAGEYQVHPRWPFHLGTAAVLALIAWRLRGPWRVFVISLAVTAASAPFISGLRPLRVQLLNVYDRWGSLLVPSLAVALLLLLAQASDAWRGKSGGRNVKLSYRALAIASVLASIILAVRTSLYDFDADRNSNHMMLNADGQCIPAYTWVANNTASDALFLVDDGLDWSKVEKDLAFRNFAGTVVWDRAELFLLVARRRCVYTERLWVNSINSADLHYATMLHHGTFGMTMSADLYKEALKHYRPDYIFWRRTSAVPRGFGAQLQSLATVVYSDQCCEIWKLRYE